MSRNSLLEAGAKSEGEVTPVAVTSPSDFAPASSKEFLDIQATIECGFTLKRVRDMIKTYNYFLSFVIFETAPPVANDMLRPVF